MLVGLLTLVAGWLASPARVPLYDGVGFPDEPYRYVVVPVGVGVLTDPPTAAAGSGPASNGTNTDEFIIASAEQGPQVQVFIPARGLHVAVTARRLQVRAVPAAPTTQPPNGSIDGNVYELTLTSDAGPVSLNKSASTAGIRLRATVASNTDPVVLFRTTGAWRVLATVRVGNDIYQGPLSGPGDYALAHLTAAVGARTPDDGGSFPMALAIVVVVMVAIVVGVAVTVRRSRRRLGR